MKRGPQSGSTSVDYSAKVRITWAPEPPQWVTVLAAEATRHGAATVAKKLGYSGSVVSQVFSNTYHKGDLARFEAVVRGAYMGATVICPVLREIGTDRCRDQQKRPFSSSSPMAARLYEACRTCSNREGSHE